MATVAHPHIDSSEYLALQAGAGWRLAAELIDGDAVVMPPSGGHAASAQGELFFALRDWQKRRRGRTAASGRIRRIAGRAVPGSRHRMVDGRASTVDLGGRDRGCPGNDLGVKRDVYVDAGVREIWLVDPDARTVTRVRAGAVDEMLGEDGTLISSLLQGFALDVAAAFRAAH